MNFSEILTYLQKGKGASRYSWDNDKGNVAKVIFIKPIGHATGEELLEAENLPGVITNIVNDKKPHSVCFTNQMQSIDITNITVFVVEGYSPSIQDTLATDWYSVY